MLLVTGGYVTERTSGWAIAWPRLSSSAWFPPRDEEDKLLLSCISNQIALVFSRELHELVRSEEYRSREVRNGRH